MHESEMSNQAKLDRLTGLPEAQWARFSDLHDPEDRWTSARDLDILPSLPSPASRTELQDFSALDLMESTPTRGWSSGTMIAGALGNGSASAKGGTQGGGSGGGSGGGTTFSPYTAGTSGNYNIELTFLGDGWTQAFYDQAKAMADLICTFITDDIADYTLQYRQGRNLISDFIDDIEINLTLRTIDGTGGILGQAGPEYWRPTVDDYHLILEGSVELDSADALTFLNAGLFDDILFHEMLHVIGLGTIWSDRQVVNGYTYTGVEGNDAYRLSGFTGSLLVEDDGGSGTAGGHWEEGSDRTAMNTGNFETGSEIMTGYINDQNWLSWVSIASLEDLGYGTIWDANRTADLASPIALSSITPAATITTLA